MTTNGANDLATVGYVRRVTIGFSLGAILLVVALVITQNVRQTEEFREGCERRNVERQSELDERQALVDVNKLRAEASSSDAERLANLDALARYRSLKRDLIRATAEVAEIPGGVVVDCVEAYPLPWPIHVLEGVSTR